MKRLWFAHCWLCDADRQVTGGTSKHRRCAECGYWRLVGFSLRTFFAKRLALNTIIITDSGRPALKDGAK